MATFATLQEAIDYLVEFDSLTEDVTASHSSALAVTEAIKLICECTSVPLWFVVDYTMRVGEDGEALRLTWERWCEHRHEVPDYLAEGDGIPF
jgi:hypothetical protein